jgi:hypothetical protein
MLHARLSVIIFFYCSPTHHDDHNVVILCHGGQLLDVACLFLENSTAICVFIQQFGVPPFPVLYHYHQYTINQAKDQGLACRGLAVDTIDRRPAAPPRVPV